MSRVRQSLAAAAVLLPLLVAAVATARAAQRTDPRVERGRYLVTITACGDCHTPLKMGPTGPAPDMSRFLSGHPESMKMPRPTGLNRAWAWAGAAANTAFAGPWGISYAANLTPDQNTGLGIWTEEMFVNAIRTGHHMGTAREIAPPMPWQSIRQATDEDLRSIFTYLRTIKPVVNHVPDYQPPVAAADAR